MNTTTRRQATDADLAEGSIVFKGNGKVQYRVWKVSPATETRETYYALQKVGSVSAPASRYYSASDLQVEQAQVAEPFSWGSYHADAEPVWADGDDY